MKIILLLLTLCFSLSTPAQISSNNLSSETKARVLWKQPEHYNHFHVEFPGCYKKLRCN